MQNCSVTMTYQILGRKNCTESQSPCPLTNNIIINVQKGILNLIIKFVSRMKVMKLPGNSRLI